MTRVVSVPYRWAADGGKLILGFDADGTFEVVAKRRSIIGGVVSNEERVFDGDNEAEQTYLTLLLKMVAVKFIEREIRSIKNDPMRRKELAENLAIMSSDLQQERDRANRDAMERRGEFDERIPSVLSPNNSTGYRRIR